ncbi:MAG: DUF2085 domain-containing protein [Rhodothermales bacterium]
MLPPFVGDAARDMIMTGYSFVCHQLAGRSFHFHEATVAVCHRCFGIYVGLIGGSIACPFLARRKGALMRLSVPILLVALIPLSVDWAGDVVRIWSNTAFSRAATGAVFGIAAGYYFALAIDEILASEKTAIERAAG